VILTVIVVLAVMKKQMSVIPNNVLAALLIIKEHSVRIDNINLEMEEIFNLRIKD